MEFQIHTRRFESAGLNPADVARKCDDTGIELKVSPPDVDGLIEVELTFGRGATGWTKEFFVQSAWSFVGGFILADYTKLLAAYLAAGGGCVLAQPFRGMTEEELRDEVFAAAGAVLEAKVGLDMF